MPNSVKPPFHVQPEPSASTFVASGSSIAGSGPHGPQQPDLAAPILLNISISSPGGLRHSSSQSPNPLEIAELRDMILAHLPVDRSFDPNLLRVSRGFYSSLLPRFYREVDLTRSGARCRGFVASCERYDLLGSHRALSVERLHIAGDAEFVDRFWRPTAPGPTVLQRLRAYLARAQSSTAALTYLRVANRHDVPLRHQRQVRQRVEFGGETERAASALAFEDDVVRLADVFPCLGGLELEGSSGAIVGRCNPLPLEGLSDEPAGKRADLTHILSLNALVRKTRERGFSLYVETIRLSSLDLPDAGFFDAARWAPVMLLHNFMLRVLGSRVSGFNTSALDLGPAFVQRFESCSWAEQEDWALLAHYAAAHEDQSGLRLVVPKNVDLSDHLDKETLGELGLHEMALLVIGEWWDAENEAADAAEDAASEMSDGDDDDDDE